MNADNFFFQEKYADTPFVQIGIEFAKLHVEAALKSAAENAELDDIGNHNGEEWISHTIVDKDSILKSYPLDNIK